MISKEIEIQLDKEKKTRKKMIEPKQNRKNAAQKKKKEVKVDKHVSKEYGCEKKEETKEIDSVKDLEE
jgi:hypothetical protein